jgi:uncharacterized Zn finger protein
MNGTLQGTWPEALERYLLSEALDVDVSPGRLRTARAADVALVWEKGRVRGAVDLNGGRFLVTLRVRPLADRAWKWGIAGLLEAMLAGRMEGSVIQAFDEGNAALFVPTTRRVECTCKGERDCRHRLALVAQMVAEAGENPFLWLSVLGREREVFLATLRVALMPETKGKEGALDRSRYWRAPQAAGATGSGDPTAGPDPTVPTSLIEQLGPVPLVDGPLLVASKGRAAPDYRSLTEFLQSYANQIAEGARVLQQEAHVIPAPPPPTPQVMAPRTRQRRSRRRYR